MKKLFLLLVIANLFMDVASYFLLPENVATHFAGGGTPNGWFSASVNLFFSLGLQGLFVLIVLTLNTGLLKTSKQLINLPNKNYWLSEENLPAFKIKWETAVYQFGCGLMLFFLMVSLLILDANFSTPVRLDTRLFVGALITFLLFMVYWIISLYRTFRLPI